MLAVILSISKEIVMNPNSIYDIKTFYLLNTLNCLTDKCYFIYTDEVWHTAQTTSILSIRLKW
jgi:hypothetical protein